MSIAEALQHIAKTRGETVKDLRNFFLIQNSPSLVVLQSYQVASPTEDADLSNLVHALIPPGQTNIQQVDSRTLEFFITDLLKESSSLNPDRKMGPFFLKVDHSADQAVAEINVMGMWSYSELLDVYCALGGLHWKIDGKCLLLAKDFKSRLPHKKDVVRSEL